MPGLMTFCWTAGQLFQSGTNSPYWTDLRRGWDLIVDMQGATDRGLFFNLCANQTRWVGIARGCSDPLPAFGLISNGLRMP